MGEFAAPGEECCCRRTGRDLMGSICIKSHRIGDDLYKFNTRMRRDSYLRVAL